MNLDNLTTEQYGMLFPIILTESNPAWPDIFAHEKKCLEKVIESKIVVRIEHFGSTAVSGLLAKPTIDIIMEINDSPGSSDAVQLSLKRIGYQYIPKPENPPPHMMFVKGYTEHGFQETGTSLFLEIILKLIRRPQMNMHGSNKSLPLSLKTTVNNTHPEKRNS